MLDLTKIIINPSPLQRLEDELFVAKKIKFYLKRDDLLHPQVSGNKWRKMKYNLLKMSELGFETLLTFGGAFSNHIYSTAAAGKIFGFKTVGIIRGEELHENSNKTLKFAAECGMKLIFVSRNEFRNKENLAEKYGKNCYILPEGGTNEFALKGVSEMVDEIMLDFDFAQSANNFQSANENSKKYIATAVGSGGTLAGICSVFRENILPIGISVVGEKEAEKVFENIHNLLKINGLSDFHFDKILNFSHGGYAKTSPELMDFIKNFEAKQGILLEQVYTGKLLFALYKLIEQNYFFVNSTIVAVHTGGLQGRNF